MDRKLFLKSLGLLPLMTSINSLQSFAQLANTFAPSPQMPLLFLGHGSPMNAIEENEFVNGFRTVAKTLPTPNAILCISAHWFTNGTKVTAMQMPRTIHDFGGFPKELFQVQYPAKGKPELARMTQEILKPAPIELDEKWGLDHGAWSVIKHLYPNADIPVVQLSIDYTKPASYHFALAQQLHSLRQKGILIIGSGNIIHNLGLVDFKNMDKDNYGFDWAIESRQKINNWLLDGNFDPIVHYEKQGNAIQLAIPTPDHYLPLIYVLGLKEKSESISLFNDKLLAGSLSMTSVKIASS
jgi:4,5-DOPA dioxygenase extradiol